MRDGAYNAVLLVGTLAFSLAGLAVGSLLDNGTGWPVVAGLAVGFGLPIVVAIRTGGGATAAWRKLVGLIATVTTIFIAVAGYDLIFVRLPSRYPQTFPILATAVAGMAMAAAFVAAAIFVCRRAWRLYLRAERSRDKRRAEALLDAIEERRRNRLH